MQDNDVTWQGKPEDSELCLLFLLQFSRCRRITFSGTLRLLKFFYIDYYATTAVLKRTSLQIQSSSSAFIADLMFL